MSDLKTVDQVRHTFAAFTAGSVTLQEFEVVVASALQSGLWTPTQVMQLLRDPFARGAIPIEMLQRLGLSDTGDTFIRAPQTSSGVVNSAGSHPASQADSSSIQRSPDHEIGINQLIGGRYLLERKIGEGGMGVVYFASDQHVKGEHFAVKVLQQEIRTNPEFLRLIREEVRKTRTLAHPNIVGVYSLNVDGNNVFVLMEYLEGKTLQDLLDQDFGRGMRFDRAWPMIEGIGTGLAYAHDHSIIHGDLKPANVFVTTSGKAKLLDFGIARAARGPARKLDGIARGALTPAYASCEMLEFQQPDARDDIYAFACIIYEAFSGKHPFGGRNALLARDSGEKPTPIDSLSTLQNAALAQGMAFDRAARTASVEALLAGLAPDVDSRNSRRRSTRKSIQIAMFVGVLTIVSGYLAAERFGSLPRAAGTQVSRPADAVVKSIAVLPFTDMSEKRDQEYFADGMAEEILDLLARIPGLTVIGRTSSFQFKGKNADLRTIGAQLNAAFVVEGSVRKSSDQVRITAQLINTQTGTHAWSETYDRHIGDVLKLQDTIAAAIVREMQLTLASNSLTARSSPKNAEAYDLILRGRHAFDRIDNEGAEEAVMLFQQALDQDPTSAEAAADLADAYSSQVQGGSLKPVVGFEQARLAANNALKLDPGNVTAHVVLADIHMFYDWDWAAAEREIQQAAAGAPQSVDMLTEAAWLSETLGRPDEALKQIQAALAQDPLNPEALQNLSTIQASRNHLPEAESAMRRVLDIRPTYSYGHYLLGLTLLARGDPNAALLEMQQETQDDGKRLGLVIIYHALGRKDDSAVALAAMLRNDSGGNAYAIAEAYGFRGQIDEAMHWLERAYAQKDAYLYAIGRDPLFTNIRDDPRFKAFLRKMNLQS